MADHRLEIVLAAKDATGRAFSQAQQRMQALTKAAFSLKGAIAGLTGVYGLKQLADSFLGAARTTEQYQVRLKVLLGSVEEGNKLFKAMSDYASRVPFTYEEIMGAATQLAGVMRGGVEEVKEWMPLIGDLAAASGLSVQQTTEQIIRMYSAGAAAADLFRERGILAMLGFQAGVSYSAEETRKRLMQAWQDPASKFRGATKELAKTWDGAMSMMADKWFQFRDEVMAAGVYDELKKQLKALNEESQKWLKANQDIIRQKVPQYIKEVKEALKKIWEVINYDKAILEYGLIGLALGGKKGAVLVGGLAHLVTVAQYQIKAFELWKKGLIDFKDIAAANFEELKQLVEKASRMYGATGPLHFKIKAPSQEKKTQSETSQHTAFASVTGSETIKEQVKAIAAALREEEKAYQAFIQQVQKYQQEAIQSLGNTQYNAAQELERALGDPDAYFGPLKSAAQEAFDDINQFAIQAARNMETAFADFFFDAMQGRFDNLVDDFKSVIDRMVAEAMAAKLSQYLFGDFGKTGQIGGWVAQAATWAKGLIGMAGGGIITEPVYGIGLRSNLPYLFGERGPEEVRPVSQVTNNQKVVVNNHIIISAQPGGKIAPEAMAQVQAKVGAATMRALRRFG